MAWRRAKQAIESRQSDWSLWMGGGWGGGRQRGCWCWTPGRVRRCGGQRRRVMPPGASRSAGSIDNPYSSLTAMTRSATHAPGPRCPGAPVVSDSGVVRLGERVRGRTPGLPRGTSVRAGGGAALVLERPAGRLALAVARCSRVARARLGYAAGVSGTDAGRDTSGGRACVRR